MSRVRPPRTQVGEALTDAQLVRRVLDGETALFEVLVHRHSQRLYRAARAILKDDDEAADVVQESFLRAYRHLNQFGGRAKFSTWLTKIAVHEARARARRTRARAVKPRDSAARRESREQPTSEPDPESRTFVQEMKTVLEAAIDALPDLYRAVFVMREIEEMSTAETAECLNLTEDVVKTRLRRARGLLRKKIYSSIGRVGPETFQFAGERCARMWAQKIRPAIEQEARRPAHPNRRA
jgi:RNA polymerase sigma-70 factor (ECF subfamily)